MNESVTEKFIMRFTGRPSEAFVGGVNDTFDYIETNMLRVGMIGLLPILRDRRERCVDNLNGKQGNQDYYLGCLAVLDHCLKEH